MLTGLVITVHTHNYQNKFHSFCNIYHTCMSAALRLVYVQRHIMQRHITEEHIDANASARTGCLGLGRLWSQVRHSRNFAQRLSVHLNASLCCRQPFDYFERYCAATDLGWGSSRYEVHAERRGRLRTNSIQFADRGGLRNLKIVAEMRAFYMDDPLCEKERHFEAEAIYHCGKARARVCA